MIKVTYKDIPGKVRCPYQFSNLCYPGCGCSAADSCWKEITKDVDESELKEMIDNCKFIIKVEE